MFNLFAIPSYQGSTLERLINANPALTIEFNKENVDTFAGAVAKDYPQAFDFYLQATNQTNTLEGKIREVANVAFPIGIASQSLLMIISASGMARYYGSQIDQLKMTNVGAAFVLAAALAEYVNACDVPAANCDGGYRRYLSAYLTLRDSMERIRKDGAAGEISPDKADQLKQSVEKFMDAIPRGADDVLTHEAKLVQMNEARREAADAVISRKRRGPPLRPGSRAARATDIVDALQRASIAEQLRPMLPTYESHKAIQLVADLSQLSAAIEQAGDDDTRVAALEPRIWRTALDVQQFARRYHLVVAKPDFSVLAEHASVKSLFVSGAAALHEAATKLAERDAIELFWEARRGEAARERWSQLLAASVAVFDIGLPDGPARMQVCYELGLALAVGKPCVVATRAETVVPFDVEISPIVFSDDGEANLRLLEAAVHAALSGFRWGGRTPQMGGAGKAAIAAIEPYVSAAAAPGHLDVQLRMARANLDDAVALRGSLDHIVGSLGARGPMILLSAWEPDAPDQAKRPRCFHVMPFNEKWSRGARDFVAEICARHEWDYVRGDESTTQRIIPGIWQEICRASAVVIDITGFNVNVGLELGLVHALGRPYRIVTRGEAEDHLFPALAKVQVHGYRDDPAQTVLGHLWLGRSNPRASAAPQQSLDEILGPFLLQAMSDRR